MGHGQHCPIRCVLHWLASLNSKKCWEGDRLLPFSRTWRIYSSWKNYRAFSGALREWFGRECTFQYGHHACIRRHYLGPCYPNIHTISMLSWGYEVPLNRLETEGKNILELNTSLLSSEFAQEQPRNNVYGESLEFQNFSWDSKFYHGSNSSDRARIHTYRIRHYAA